MPATLQTTRAAGADSFCAAVACHHPTLLRLCRRMMGNEEDARDALQEALLKAYERLGQFRAEAAMGTWLYVIVRRTCCDALRRRRRRPLPQDPLLPMAFPAVWADPLAAAEQAELRRSVRLAVGRLSPAHREVVVLRAFWGLSCGEAARRLHLPDGTVKSRMSRACAALRESLAEAPYPGEIPGGRPSRRAAAWARPGPSGSRVAKA